MKSDRELLELAARAAGLRVCGWVDSSDSDEGGEFVCLSVNFEPRTPCWDWNPLTDDGDALRLAVKLGLTVECDFNDSDSCVASETRGDILVDESSGMLSELIGEPEFSATRRAIVRAAAAIGESMQ